MSTYDAVGTEGRAKEIFEEKGANSTDYSSQSCECGETMAVVGYDENYNSMGIIAVCEGCGDDSHFTSDVYKSL